MPICIASWPANGILCCVETAPAQHSPDRVWWWTGREWLSAWSSDGRWWFDGTSWRAVPTQPERELLPQRPVNTGAPKVRRGGWPSWSRKRRIISTSWIAFFVTAGTLSLWWMRPSEEAGSAWPWPLVLFGLTVANSVFVVANARLEGRARRRELEAAQHE